MERKINEAFNVKGSMYACLKAKAGELPCSNCCFGFFEGTKFVACEKDGPDESRFGRCTSGERNDCTNVYFAKIDKANPPKAIESREIVLSEETAKWLQLHAIANDLAQRIFDTIREEQGEGDEDTWRTDEQFKPMAEHINTLSEMLLKRATTNIANNMASGGTIA